MARSLLLSTALQTGALGVTLALAAHAQPLPNARPTGGVVVAGAASISQAPSLTTITQSTPRAAVNWHSFDVGSQQSVSFVQPSASAVTLNRVTGSNPSQIAGHIGANGQVVLVNQSGVVFYKGAQVNTNGLMVSAADISNTDFMAGRMNFSQPAKPDARIVNAGTISIADTGLAALVAPQVANSGVISAKLGHVVLAGARTATLDLYGDGLLTLDVNNAVTQTPSGATALVTNSGVIHADGGTVQLTARAADGIVQNLVDAGGTIRAATVDGHTGTIALNGIGGSIVLEGGLAAPGSAPSDTGGAIEIVSSGNVTLASTARIDASGRAGGGVVAIGTTLARAQGGASVQATQTAQNVTIRHGATIAANAISNGDGGHVAVLSANATEMDGSISATGGADGGNGGMVETSGAYLNVTGSVDLAAPRGSIGTWLLDPTFLNVVSGTAGSGSEDQNFTTNGGTVLATDGLSGTPDTISSSIINASTANVVLQALQTLTVAASINLGNLPNQSLTLEAGGTLDILPGVSVTATGAITLSAGGAGAGTPPPPPAQASPLLLVEGTVSSGAGKINLLTSAAGKIDITAGASVAATGITMSSGSGGITIDGSVGQAGAALDISSTGSIAEPTGGSLIGASLISSGGIGATVNLAGSGNAVGLVRGISVTGGDFNLVDSANLTLAGTLNANNLFFEVAKGGGTLTLGLPSFVAASVPATLVTPSGGRISLVADTDTVAVAGSSITTTAGTVQIAPFSTITASLDGGSGLAIGTPLLGIIQTNGGTLDIGGFTNAPLGAFTPVASAGSVDIAATVDLTGIAGTLRMFSSGAITQSGGALTVGALAGSGVNWTLGNAANAIGTLGTVVASNFILNDSSALSLSGTVAAKNSTTIASAGTMTITGELASPTVQLSAPGISLAGTLIAVDLNLTASGAISETGSLTAVTLAGSAGGTASLTGSNFVIGLGNFTAGSFALNDTISLGLSGTLNAADIAIRDPAGQITFGNGAAIITGGNVRPAGAIQPALEPANGGAGAYLLAARFVQTGSSTVTGQDGGPATLQIAVTGGEQFDRTLGLQASGAWLILNLANTSATGNMIVSALDVSYTAPGSANLSGTIAGITGGPAAAAGFIQPATNANYLFNNCVIASPVCQATTPASTQPTPSNVVTQIAGTQNITLVSSETSTLGGILALLQGVPLPQVASPPLAVIAWPIPPAPLPQLTDPDVVPPDIGSLDY